MLNVIRNKKKKSSQCLACILTVVMKKKINLYHKEVDQTKSSNLST